jgi:hypothetical protein
MLRTQDFAAAFKKVIELGVEFDDDTEEVVI